MVETQLCKRRGKSETFVGDAYSIFHLQYGVCELNVQYGCSYSVSPKKKNYGRSFARVLYFILMKDIGR